MFVARTGVIATSQASVAHSTSPIAAAVATSGRRRRSPTSVSSTLADVARLQAGNESARPAHAAIPIHEIAVGAIRRFFGTWSAARWVAAYQTRVQALGT